LPREIGVRKEVFVISQGLSPTKTETENRRIGEGQQSMNKQRVAEYQSSRASE